MNEGLEPRSEKVEQGSLGSGQWWRETKRMFKRGFADFERRHPEMPKDMDWDDQIRASALRSMAERDSQL